MKPRRLNRRLQHLELARQSIRRRCRNTKHSEPPGVSQRRITLLPVRSTNRIDHEIHTAAVGQFLQLRQPILLAIVDRMVQSAFCQKLVLARTRRSKRLGADLLRDVECRKSNASAGVVDQHRLTSVQRTHHHEQRISSQVVHRNRGRLFKRQLVRLLKHLRRFHHDHFRLTAKASHGHDRLAGERTVHILAGSFDHTANLVTHHARLRRRVGI